MISTAFQEKIEHEFIHGSAISPDLFRATVEVVSDTEVLPGGDVCYPIHEALNWQVTRFGQQARTTQQAAILRNEDGSCWQLKSEKPRSHKGKAIKYDTPVGNGSRAFLPTINRETSRAIANHYGCEVSPPGESFWSWLEQHPEIPIIWTEGGKKALSLLSQGYVAIALYGVHGGYRVKDELGNPISPNLIADVARFAQPGRSHILAFDQDAKPSTIAKVNRALWRFGSLLEQSGGTVAITSWKPEQGKGVDDLIVQSGVDAWHTAYSDAMPLAHWQIWQQLSGQLTHKASIRLNTAHLTELNPESLPDTGIIAIASAKGTEKTKFIGRLTAESRIVLAAGHRICLMRNLCQRWGINYRGDLDKANGQFITGSGYTLKVGLCVDSLLAIDPEKFRGCDLIIDEVTQVFRHLITSSTCRKDGRLPALLAKLHQLIQVAKRVIVADADLNNTVLDYLRSLRGDNAPIFLVRNDYQPQGYPVEFLQSPDATIITARLLNDCRHRLPGQVLFVATDSKMGSKTLARLVSQVEGLGQRVLVINSETSGGESEQEFINHPDQVLARGEYDVIICSPSLATGVSIEAQGIISRVYGIFYGASSTDGDMAQSLARVREPVERVVWCAPYGRNFSKVSRSTNPLELKSQLKQRTDATVMLTRSQLREDIAGEITGYDWQSDPHLNLWARITADQNRAMHSLRDALLVRLRYEGNQVTLIDAGSDQAVKLLTKHAKEEIRQIEADAVSKAAVLDRAEVLQLETKEAQTPDERLAIARYYMGDFYATEEVTSELVRWDNDGRRRGELLNLETLIYPDVAIERDLKGLEKQASWNQGIVPWDVGTAELRRRLRAELKLNDFLDPDKEWTKHDLKPYADTARELKPQIKLGLNFSITDGMSDTQIIHQLLSHMGIKFEWRWSRSVAGYEGEKLRVYRLDTAHWQQLTDVLDRRAVRREILRQTEQESGSPPLKSSYTGGGDPIMKVPLEEESWLTSESLADVRMMWRDADSEEVRAEIRRFVPLAVLQRAVASHQEPA